MSSINNNYAAELEELKNQDISYNKVSSAKFIFYLQLAGSVVLFLTMCYVLWTHRYTGKPDVEVQPSTLYTPEYK